MRLTIEGEKTVIRMARPAHPGQFIGFLVTPHPQNGTGVTPPPANQVESINQSLRYSIWDLVSEILNPSEHP